jgi:uncharacterized protein (TIGR03435 family)
MRSTLLALILCVAASGQTTDRPEFEVASIRPSATPGMGGQVNVGLHIDGALVRCNYFSLKEYIGMAYNLKMHQVVGPDWLASERFDIAAKIPQGSPRDQVAPMLRALLTDRFHMQMHRDQKEFPVYALTVAKGGLKIKELPDNSAAAAEEVGREGVNVSATGGRGGVSAKLPGGASFKFADNHVEFKKTTMASFTDVLARFMDRPVVDMTDLKGTYDFAFDLSPEDFRSMQIQSAITAGVTLPPEVRRFAENASNDSLHTALAALGLKLEARKAPIEVLVVDRMEKSPTEN